MREARPGWRGILERYAVNTLLMELNEKPIGIQQAAFHSPLWALVYWDDRSLVYVRRSAAPEELLHRFEYRIVNPNDLLPSLGRRATLMAAIAELERALGVKAELEFLPLQPGEVSRTWADTSEARKALGYAPATSLEEGIGRFVAWLRESS